MKTGIWDAVIEFLPFVQEWPCMFKHIYTEINYRGKIRNICINCSMFIDGDYFE